MARRAAPFVAVWEFSVPPRNRAAFVRAYAPGGAWARLFRGGAGYLGTELLRIGKGRFITIDRWRSAGHFSSFFRAHRNSYRELDAACSRLTSGERLLGRGHAVFSRRM